MDCNKLNQAPLFRGIKPEDIEGIINSIPHKVRKFHAGSLIAHCGDAVTSLMIVTGGMVKAEMIDYAGRVIKIEDIPAPGALASAFLFGNRNRFPVNVIAVSDVELLIIEKADFLFFMMKNDIILANFLDMISNRSQFLSEKIKFLSFKTIKGKLAQYILQKTEHGTKTLKLEITQNELADYFGVARPSVARALGDMEEDGLIEANGKNVIIIDRQKLVMLTAD